jgi:uncharacterized membrane protein
MRFLAKLFFRGLAAILPLALTGYLVYAAVFAGESLLHGVIAALFPNLDYRPGMGFAVSMVVVLIAGALMYSVIVRAVYQRLTALVARIPVVKSVYGMLVDVVRLFGSPEGRPFKKVVLVSGSDGVEQLGFLTRDDCADLPGFGADKVTVFVPMSYQLGGFTWVVARERVRVVDMGVEEALRFAVTAGVSRSTLSP